MKHTWLHHRHINHKPTSIGKWKLVSVEKWTYSQEKWKNDKVTNHRKTGEESAETFSFGCETPLKMFEQACSELDDHRAEIKRIE